uniref:Glutamate/phenylalanine/leucine/valine/L-tryptophan dehydrogenase C-terminal domain-containing protein n=1 Tax=Vannella robusta TaxID=1487602 RepID=A0A7S4I5S4_9EUKA
MKPRKIAKHITALYAAKMLNATSSTRSLSLRLQQEKKTGAIYIVPSQPEIRKGNPSEALELRIEREYLQEGYQKAREDLCQGNAFRVQVFRTAGTVSFSSKTKLRMYFVQQSKFPTDEPVDIKEPIDLLKIGDSRYVDAASDVFQKDLVLVLSNAQNQLGPAVKVIELSTTEEIRIVVAYRHGTTHNFFSGLTALYHYYGLHSNRKYIERYNNGLCSYSLYLYKNEEEGNPKSLLELGESVAKDASLIYVLPRTSLSELFREGKLNAKEVTYAYAVWKFAHQFFTCCGSTGSINMEDVSKTVKREMMTEARVKEVIFSHLEIIRLLYSDFEARFLPNGPAYVDGMEEIQNKITRTAVSDIDMKILFCMCKFNSHILKTNFYKNGKIALSFRLDPVFIQHSDYSRVPHAIFFVVGAEFRGFHVRFVDVARGGIRIIRSANAAAFAMNVSSLFEENYNLALTQQRKNKDIPEGGSKGTILLSTDHQDKASVAFQKYVDALLDLLLPGDEIRDYLGVEELLFLGPDEGTADYMNWASQHAKERKYRFWKAFTTGKSRELGGIPHDFYGMTTRSIHQYVLGILNKKELNEEKMRKFQTGGPDGDLGSNEIKISKDNTIGIVDGSGVLYDPEGINREELLRLANERLMSNHFDTAKLSSSGFYISVQDTDRVLPDGTKVDSGLMFRNTFHLQGKFLFGTDMFVPCGGRPAAVNGSNVHMLWDETKKSPMFQYIVEGANLFFTQDARLQLEKWGVVLFKDASANKGGVTSSSLEVLAALSLNDEEFAEHMQVRGDTVPPFYAEYVREVHRIIEDHARCEFECLWKEHAKTKVPLSVLSDLVSEKINRLNDDICKSSLWDNESLRERVIAAAVPQNLISLLGRDVLIQRVPDSYLRAIFGAHLACNFVYSHGLDSGEFGFFEFMQGYLQA